MRMTPAVRKALESRVEAIRAEIKVLRDEGAELEAELNGFAPRSKRSKAGSRKASPVRDAVLAALESGEFPAEGATQKQIGILAGVKSQSVSSALHTLRQMGKARYEGTGRTQRWFPTKTPAAKPAAKPGPTGKNGKFGQVRIHVPGH